MQKSLSNPGTLVRSRGREWVVLPDSIDNLLLVKPLGGLDEEVTGLMPAIEKVESATFSLPTAADSGDFASGRLLREAGRLSTRSGAGPFRSFARIALEPRPYQLVPLMMALKIDPVRLLIADDVGIGKTIEAALIAREMLDRGEIRRFTVLCPPHLAEQWKGELSNKFHIDAELVLSSTIHKLERDLPLGVSVFDRYPFTVVSLDFVKTPRRFEDFVNRCPEFVIVDEAHTCTLSGGAGKGRQQRHELLRRIADNPERHLVLVTATPHSGKEDAFRSLLGLIDKEFVDMPLDIELDQRENVRRKLAKHLIQRRRADIRRFLDADTAFPERYDRNPELTYALSEPYKSLLDDVISFAREIVYDSVSGHRQRVRFWSALALLRCVSSSPAAAAATLRSRAPVDTVEESIIDDIGRQTVLDQGEEDDEIIIDLSPGSAFESVSRSNRNRLLEFARRAEALSIEDDVKFKGMVGEIRTLISEGFRPVIFCRFIDTAEYVAKHLRDKLPNRTRIEAVTGKLPPKEREDRISNLIADGGEYVLVCTDCLSEGINLQDGFDAVLHYDLAWNPTRHEQREGRVDRFGQSSPTVKVVTYYGTNNPIDGVILDVLIRKHKSIKSQLGVTVAVPSSSEQIAETLFEGALFRERASANPQQLSLGFVDDLQTVKAPLHAAWENARDKEQESRSRFAQRSIHPDAVAAELESVRKAIGWQSDVKRFVASTFKASGVPVHLNGKIDVSISNETPRSLRQAIGMDEPFTGVFEYPVESGQVYLGRTSPVVEGLASWTLDQALDPVPGDSSRIASRCGVARTLAVTTRTTIVVARLRYHLSSSAELSTLLCEEIVPLAFNGDPSSPSWLSADAAEDLLSAVPSGNIIQSLRDQQLELLFDGLTAVRERLSEVAESRAADQLEAHRRVREAAQGRGRVSIEPVLPVDILGAYVLLPKLD